MINNNRMKKFCLHAFYVFMIFVAFCLFIVYAGAQVVQPPVIRELALSKQSDNIYRADWVSDGWDQSKTSTVFTFMVEKYFAPDTTPIVQYYSTPLPWLSFYCNGLCRVTADFTLLTKLIQPRPGADLDFKVIKRERAMMYQVKHGDNFYFNLDTKAQFPLPIEIRTSSDLPKWYVEIKE